MDISIVLAKIIGIYFLVVGLSLLINKQFFKDMVKNLATDNTAMLIIAFITLILGSLLVIIHNIWVLDWRLIITIFSWMTFVAGIIRMLFPTRLMKLAGTFSSGHYFSVVAIFSIVMGIILLYFGFCS